jgi:hypothetical protein
MQLTKYIDSPSHPASRLLKEEEVAHQLSVDLDFMRQLRQSGTGPKWSDLDGCVRYRVADLETWLQFRGQVSEVLRQIAKNFSIPELAADLLDRERRECALDELVAFIIKTKGGQA